MKKDKTEKEQKYTKPEEAIEPNGTSIDELADVNSIQEFIEMKKLQNRILGKMIEALNTTENQYKSNNK